MASFSSCWMGAAGWPLRRKSSALRLNCLGAEPERFMGEVGRVIDEENSLIGEWEGLNPEHASGR
jgi:hypothetical protein